MTAETLVVRVAYLNDDPGAGDAAATRQARVAALGWLEQSGQVGVLDSTDHWTRSVVPDGAADGYTALEFEIPVELQPTAR